MMPFRLRFLPLLTLLILESFLAVPARAADDEEDEDKDKGPKTYADVITEDAESDDGVFTVHRIDDKLYFEIPQTLLGQDMLLVSRIAAVPASLQSGRIAAGHKAGEQVVRWERVDDRILLRRISYANVADPELPIYRSVVNNNVPPILAAFDVEIEGPALPEGADPETHEPDPATATVVIEVSGLFAEDVPALSGLDAELRKDLKVKKLDKDRSFLNYARAYPFNVEVRYTATYETSEPPTEASTETMTLEMNQSLVLLPGEPMRKRYEDQRVGYFSHTWTNFGLDAQKAPEQSFIARWRLEPKDPAAYRRGELVEPVKPIVWYIDPSTPEKWRPWVIRGVEDWNVAFETAGFRNAVECRIPPTPEEDPEWNGEDIRYSVVRWAANTMRNAMGPSVSDPRSGEILESDIVWYHNHMRSYRNRLMLETGAANPLTRRLPIDEEMMGEAMRAVIAHEVGHALGLPHNMIASAAYRVEDLRDPEFCRRMGVAPTIMDYARQNYIAQPGDGLTGADFIRQIGPYDHYSINWGYRVIPEARTAEEEKPVLDAWIREHEDDPMYKFSPQRVGLAVDPRAQTEDLGDDPVAASGYGVENLKRVAPMLIEWTSVPGEDYADLSELYGELVWCWGRYMRHVVTVVGGMYEDLKASDQDGVVYRPVPADRQRRAMAFLAEQALTTPEWLLDPEVLQRIEHAGGMERMRGNQARVLDALFDPQRMQRMIESEALLGDEAYGLLEFIDDMHAAVWGSAADQREVDTYRRNLQRAYVERLEWLMTEEPELPTSSWFWRTPMNLATTDIRAAVRGELMALQREAERGAGRARDRMTRLHLEDVSQRIEGLLANGHGE